MTTNSLQHLNMIPFTKWWPSCNNLPWPRQAVPAPSASYPGHSEHNISPKVKERFVRQMKIRLEMNLQDYTEVQLRRPERLAPCHEQQQVPQLNLCIRRWSRALSERHVDNSLKPLVIDRAPCKRCPSYYGDDYWVISESINRPQGEFLPVCLSQQRILFNCHSREVCRLVEATTLKVYRRQQQEHSSVVALLP